MTAKDDRITGNMYVFVQQEYTGKNADPYLFISQAVSGAVNIYVRDVEGNIPPEGLELHLELLFYNSVVWYNLGFNVCQIHVEFSIVKTAVRNGCLPDRQMYSSNMIL